LKIEFSPAANFGRPVFRACVAWISAGVQRFSLRENVQCNGPNTNSFMSLRETPVGSATPAVARGSVCLPDKSIAFEQVRA
jgi:hypothetical protein